MASGAVRGGVTGIVTIGGFASATVAFVSFLCLLFSGVLIIEVRKARVASVFVVYFVHLPVVGVHFIILAYGGEGEFSGVIGHFLCADFQYRDYFRGDFSYQSSQGVTWRA